MNLRRMTTAIVLLLGLTGSLSAQNFFWSLQGFGEGAINSDLVVSAPTAPSNTVNLYYDSNGQDIVEGFNLDFSWDNNGVIGFTAAETFDADITFGPAGPVLSQRWGDFAGPAVGDVTSDFVNGFITVNLVSGTGILESNIPGVLDPNGFDFVDTLYDQSAEAFLIGSFDFEVLSFGEASIIVNGLVVNGGVDLNSPFSGLTFTVPEPSAATLLVIGLAGLTRRRREG